MGSNFCRGFEKTSGVLGAVTAPIAKAGKLAIKAGGGALNVGMTGIGAVADGLSAYNKMTAAAMR